MASLSSELSISELAGLLCAIVLILIPLIIWAFHNLEKLRGLRSINSKYNEVRAKLK